MSSSAWTSRRRRSRSPAQAVLFERLAPEGVWQEPGTVVLRVDRPGRGDPDRRAHRAELPAAPERRRHADRPIRARDRRHRRARSSTRARPRRACARWRRRRSSRAAASATASACSTWCSSRRTTSPRPAGSARRSRAARARTRTSPIEVEAETADEVREALAAGAPRILLDNMTPDEMRAIADEVAGRAELEASRRHRPGHGPGRGRDRGRLHLGRSAHALRARPRPLPHPGACAMNLPMAPQPHWSHRP